MDSWCVGRITRRSVEDLIRDSAMNSIEESIRGDAWSLIYESGSSVLESVWDSIKET